MDNPYAPPPRDRPPTPPPPQDTPEHPHPPRQDVPPRPQDVPPPRLPSPQSQPSPEEPPEGIDPARARRAFRLVGMVGLLALGSLVTTMLPLPWQAMAVVFSLAAVVAGVAALRTVWRTPQRRALLPPLAAGIGVSLMLFVSSLSVLATWPIQQARQECLARAITVSARDTCEAEYRDALRQLSDPTP